MFVEVMALCFQHHIWENTQLMSIDQTTNCVLFCWYHRQSGIAPNASYRYYLSTSKRPGRTSCKKGCLKSCIKRSTLLRPATLLAV